MRTKKLIGTVAATTAAGALLGWPTWAAVEWARYGRRRGDAGAFDPLADRFLPSYEVEEHHRIRVAAPVAVAWTAVTGVGFERSAIVRGIIRARERLLNVRGDAKPWPPGGLVAQMRASGWGVLAEVPGREVVLGAVTQPWRADVRFRALAPEEFAAFDEPGFVKIVSTLTVDPVAPGISVVRTQTRVATTDATARSRFRLYWAAFSPGIMLIRRALLRVAKRDAERRHRRATRPRSPSLARA